jgi:uncharacterized SAM-binding protein YcdF (DUF218 family)
MFFLTRIIFEFFTPFVFSLFLFLCSFFSLLRQRRKWALLFSGSGLFIIFFCGYGIVARDQLYALENRYAPVDQETLQNLKNEKIPFVVILGSGHISDPRLPVTSQIGGSSLYRLIEGIRIFRELTGSILVISGGIGYDPVPNADIVSRVALSIGVPPNRIIVENRPRDTLQEAEMLQPTLKDNRFILVSSAAHMPRAMQIFNRLGMKPIADPTDFTLHSTTITAESSFPSLRNLDISRRFFYERAGTIWMELKEYFRNAR